MRVKKYLRIAAAFFALAFIAWLPLMLDAYQEWAYHKYLVRHMKQRNATTPKRNNEDLERAIRAIKVNHYQIAGAGSEGSSSDLKVSQK